MMSQNLNISKYAALLYTVRVQASAQCRVEVELPKQVLCQILTPFRFGNQNHIHHRKVLYFYLTSPETTESLSLTV